MHYSDSTAGFGEQVYEAELSDPEGLKQALSDLIVEKLTPFRVSL